MLTSGLTALVATLSDKPARYAALLAQIDAVTDGESDLIANLANITALVRDALPLASWVGFYLMRDGELVLGPFQGKVACVRIALTRGVCGAAARERAVQLVPDVDQFPGHIACDAGSRSEVVVPVIHHDRVVAVLDVDSYQLAAFDQQDADGLIEVAQRCAGLAW
ncbi:MAG: GAF domain-containing protein [Kofleriaceae bacterium]|nr:GAF domain-containing protein [Kofleriaceae bacterium]